MTNFQVENLHASIVQLKRDDVGVTDSIKAIGWYIFEPVLTVKKIKAKRSKPC